MYKIALSILLASILCLCIQAAPAEYAAAGSAQVGGNVPSLFTFENGNVGVNFLGFQAAAGLGGLLTGNAAHGGLHAHASTPFGQAAQAGLAGNTIEKGKSVGGLYADATAGGGIAAGAGLAGSVDSEEAHGISYAGSSVGHLYKGVTKVNAVAPAVEVAEVQVVPEKVTVVESKPQTTYIERTVIPNYQEKTIYVPSYVEKTVRVPTVVEQKVRVPAAPTVIEKAVEVPPAEVNFETSKIKVVEHVPVTTVHKKVVHTHPHFSKHLFVGGYGSGYGGGGYSGGYGGGGITGTNSVFVHKAANPQLFQDIFNIPISTLGAVSRLVSGIAGGTSGSLAVSKSYSAY